MLGLEDHSNKSQRPPGPGRDPCAMQENKRWGQHGSMPFLGSMATGWGVGGFSLGLRAFYFFVLLTGVGHFIP